jgi:hypothetical protein
MNEEINFLVKVVRNALILGGLYFVSVYAVGEISYEMCKPIIVFLGTYIFTELAKHYKLDYPNKKRKIYTTLLY